MVASVHTYFTQHPKGNDIMFNKTLEQHLDEMGIRPSSMIETLESILDTRQEYLVKGYYNDPRDGNMEVPF